MGQQDGTGNRGCKPSLSGESSTTNFDAQAWQLEEIRASLSEIDSGRVVCGKEVAAWLESWGKEDEKARPPV